MNPDAPARDFFSPEEGEEIVAAIQQAEKVTSGEIRIHLENRTKGRPALEAAARVFQKLRMHETAERNGVLIYLAVKDHRFAIFADEGINAVAPDGFWKEVATAMETNFRAGEFVRGLVQAVEGVGKALAEYFPYQADDVNELPDDISFGEH